MHPKPEDVVRIVVEQFNARSGDLGLTAYSLKFVPVSAACVTEPTRRGGTSNGVVEICRSISAYVLGYHVQVTDHFNGRETRIPTKDIALALQKSPVHVHYLIKAGCGRIRQGPFRKVYLGALRQLKEEGFSIWNDHKLGGQC